MKTIELSQISDNHAIFLNPNESCLLITPEAIESCCKFHHVGLDISCYKQKNHYILRAEEKYFNASYYSYCFLGHIVTKNGKNLYIYQSRQSEQAKSPVRHPVLTIVNPEETELCMSPHALLEIVLTSPTSKWQTPEIENIGNFKVNLIRKEYIPSDDLCIRKTSDTFAVVRWTKYASQLNYFFQIDKSSYPFLLKNNNSIEHVASVVFKSFQRKRKVDLYVYMNNYCRNSLENNNYYDLESHSQSYGFANGLFYGKLIIGNNVNYIQIPKGVKEQVIEIPVSTTNCEVPYHQKWKYFCAPNQDRFIGFQCRDLDDHVINDTVFQRFSLKNASNLTGNIGTLELTQNLFKRTFKIISQSVNAKIGNKISFNKILGELKDNCLVISNNSIEAVNSKNELIEIICPCDYTEVFMRKNQKLLIKLPLFKDECAYLGVWQITSPSFVKILHARKYNNHDSYELAINPNVSRVEGMLVCNFKYYKHNRIVYIDLKVEP